MPDATSAPLIPPGGDGLVPSRVVKWREAPPVSQDPTPELEPFPLDALPPLVRDFLLSCAASARVPVEVAAAHVLPFPVVTIVGGIQPQVLATIRSKDHDGLLERFLPIVTTAQDAYWTETEPASAAALGDIDAITDLFITLRDWPEEPTGEGLIIQRTPAARKIWAAWYNRNIDRITALSASRSAAPSASRSAGPGMPDGQAGLPVEGFYRKLPAHVARIALVLHALWNPGAVRDPLSATTMTHATRIGECLRTHIDRAAHLIDIPPRWSPPKPTLAQRALRVLANADTPDGWLGRTVLYERLSRPHPEELTRTLEHLAAHDLVTVRRITHPRSRKPVEQWRYVN